ncbi:DoxX family protein [Niabella ginsengisoli]|uniref:DoxX family protein n=1 Tax=Niabella ginsengisoli TaxID=522298 RepID=A0ABS9SIE7_9BACT|nr:DoxX family protein [Niabella ginsengisoli]MCH5598143.1 DoxX family protein [Niabella ginsengisoli]
MQHISLYMMSLLYVLAGVNHFWHPRTYEKIMPPWVKWHKQVVIISGIFEIVLGLLLLIPFLQSFAAWGIILLLILIFPANIQMMLNYKASKNTKFWMTIVRLPLQIVLIWWAYTFTK